MTKQFKILSIDGGGIRGIYPAWILQKVKEKLSIDFSNYFDLIVGTSTGSIIAGALATDYPIENVVSLYETEGSKIFSKQGLSMNGLWKSQYSNDHFKKLLNETFQDKKMTDAKTILVIPSTDITNGTVHVFKSPYSSDLVRDGDVRIADAVLSSCSAPAYFNPTKLDTYLLADGGLWANNPALVGITEALGKRLKKDRVEIKLFSIGTGLSKRYYKNNNSQNKNWGLVNGWENKNLIDFIFNLQSLTSENIVQLILPPENYLRINFQSDLKLSLDDVNSVESLKSKADLDFTHQFEKIKNFLN